MKTKAQGFYRDYPEKWTNFLPYYYSKNCELKIGNYKQSLPVHYHDKEFLTDEIISKLERKLGI